MRFLRTAPPDGQDNDTKTKRQITIKFSSKTIINVSLQADGCIDKMTKWKKTCVYQ